jgi:hypothetical protein
MGFVHITVGWWWLCTSYSDSMGMHIVDGGHIPFGQYGCVSQSDAMRCFKRSRVVMFPAQLQAKGRAKPSQNRPGQAGPKVLASRRLWPGLGFEKAKARPSGRGF